MIKPEKCAAWKGGREVGRWFRTLLEGKRRDKRFDNRLGGRQGISIKRKVRDVYWFQTCFLEKTRQHSHTKNSSWLPYFKL